MIGRTWDARPCHCCSSLSLSSFHGQRWPGCGWRRLGTARDVATVTGNARDTCQTRVTGTGFSRVQIWEPVPVPMTTRDIPYRGDIGYIRQ